MPPPAPIKPQMKPIITPQITDWTARFFGEILSIASLVVMTGRTRKVMNTEKLPIVWEGTRLAT